MTEALSYLSFTIAAFVFNITLCILVSAKDSDGEQSNVTFRNFTYILLLGNLITILEVFFRRCAVVPIPYVARLVIYVLSFMANVMLTYFFAIYAETFFKMTTRRNIFSQFNKFLLIGLFILATVCFFITLPNIGEDKYSYLLPTVPKYILAYFSELYYLVYAMAVFFVNRKELNQRARKTAASAFSVTIGIIIFEVFNPTEIYFNYFGATLGLYIFYIGVETPDYKNLINTMKELEVARQKADEANRSKSDFLANMSHEIRTPINAVVGMNEMILREAKNEQILDYSRNIESAGRSLLAIINDILDLSKIEAGKMEINEAPYRFSSLINDIAVMISIKAKEKNLEFDVDVDETLPDGLFGDEIRIRQVMVNVLNNAVKYTEKGSVKLSVGYDRSSGAAVDSEVSGGAAVDSEVGGGAAGESCTLHISVTDTGIGLKPEDLPKVFEKFDRFDMDKNKAVEGSGLGLAIVKQLVTMMNGTVDVTSEYGKGSTFTLNIPQKIDEDVAIGDFRKRFSQYSAGKDKYHELFHAPEAEILVVDDTILNLTVVKALLKNTDIKIDTAQNAAQALVMTCEKHYDTILLDNRMPGMNGSEALPIMRSQEGGLNKETPIICLTADAISGARERYLAEGFTDYLNKPIQSDALERMLLTYLPKDKTSDQE
ncbi:MAG: response regulator [Lachnospiraceae bacterium]|nr:response regulator [Lachnospiraceae bacterium]